MLPQPRRQRNKHDEKRDPQYQDDFLDVDTFNQTLRYLQVVVVTRGWIYLHTRGFLSCWAQFNIFYLTMLHWIRWSAEPMHFPLVLWIVIWVFPFFETLYWSLWCMSYLAELWTSSWSVSWMGESFPQLWLRQGPCSERMGDLWHPQPISP